MVELTTLKLGCLKDAVLVLFSYDPHPRIYPLLEHDHIIDPCDVDVFEVFIVEGHLNTLGLNDPKGR